MSLDLERALGALNPEQHAAAVASGHTLVTACPGSGKTKMLSVKAAHLLRDPTSKVCLVTFTKDAADELRDRTLQLLHGGDAATRTRLLSGTFHSICFRMLRKLRSIDLKAILNPGEVIDYAARVIAETGVDAEPNDVLAAVERHRANAPSLTAAQDKRLANAYVGLMRRNGKVDFTELVTETIKALDEGNLTPLAMTHLLVDEFQDTDQLQMRWIRHHSRAGARVTVVGDDDQSIFSWRFALGYPGMMQFATEHRAEQIVLGTNYRCLAEILAAGERLIVNNSARIPKVLLAARGSGTTVRALAFPRKSTEAAAVAAALSDFRTGSYSAAVLARTNRSLMEVTEALKIAGIPFVAPPGADALDSPEAALLVDVCDFVTGKSNRGIEHLLSHTHFPEADLKVMADLLRHGADFGPQRLRSAGVSPDGIEAARSFSQSFVRLRSIYAGDPERVDLVLHGAHSWLVEQAGWSVTHIRNVRLGICVSVMAKLRGNLEERVIAFRELGKRERDAGDDRRVVCSTMHASKGLEWDRVFIVQANDGVVPSSNATLIDEERRLFYVAITRARDQLTISSAGGIASPFVAESGIALESITTP